jgi:hypothetical protein
MLLDINSPNPVPLSDFVANFENNLGNISESIPEPVSFTLTIILPPPPLSASSSFSLFVSTRIVPWLVKLIALLIKLKITRDNR